MSHREDECDVSDLDERSVYFHRKIFPILTKFDVVGLIKIGCPRDEYFHESKMIAAALAKRDLKCMTLQDVLDDVDAVFYQQFETYESYPNCADGDFETVEHGRHHRRIIIGEKESFKAVAIAIYESIAILN